MRSGAIAHRVKESPLPVSSAQPTILALSTYEKGQAFLREAARLGARVLLLTIDKLRDADWPRDILARLLTMPEDLAPAQILNTVTYLARTEPIHSVVALDEFDLESAALLREHMQLPGMGQTATRLFRDKLAMRTHAQAAGIPVPEFSPILLHGDVHHFLRNTPGPWLLKPRTNASAVGIHKIDQPDDIWPLLDLLGDAQSHYLLERFVPGDIFHAEGVTHHGSVLFALPFAYGEPPMQTMHEGGIFSTRVLDRAAPLTHDLLELHGRILTALDLHTAVTHTEFIRGHADGKLYFLETAARVGGAYIADLVHFATGLNPWQEWARLEWSTLTGTPYHLPALQELYAGSVISLARQQSPDTSAYLDPEIAHRLTRPHHAGLMVRSSSPTRVEELVRDYTRRFLADFQASMPVPDKPTA